MREYAKSSEEWRPDLIILGHSVAVDGAVKKKVEDGEEEFTTCLVWTESRVLTIVDTGWSAAARRAETEGRNWKKSAHKNIHQTTSNHCDDDNDNNMPKYIPIKNMILVCLPQRHTFVRVKRKNRRGQMSGFGMIKYVYYAVNLLYLCLNYSPRQQIAEKSSYSIGHCLTFCSFQSK